MASVKFNNRALKKEQAKLYVYLYHKGIRAYTHSNFMVRRDLWLRKDTDFAKELSKAKDADRRDSIIRERNAVNDMLQQMEDLQLYLVPLAEQLADPKLITNDWLTKRVQEFDKNQKASKGTNERFVNYVQNVYLPDREGAIQPTTIRLIKAICSRIQVFEETSFKSLDIAPGDLMMKDINHNFRLQYEHWMRKEGYEYSTINKHFSYIRTICTYARKNGVEIYHRIEEVKVEPKKLVKQRQQREVEEDEVYFTPTEVQVIQALENLPRNEDIVRDWFVISYYTSQRISDFMRFKTSMLYKEGGRTFIEFNQRKTGEYTVSYLPEAVTDIIKKYNGEFPPTYSEARYNKIIKRVCQKAHINEPTTGRIKMKVDGRHRKVTVTKPKYHFVTSHIGRRSAISNNSGNISQGAMMNQAGHKSAMQHKSYDQRSKRTKAMQYAKEFEASIEKAED